jgi:hypothetical protein
MLREGRPIIPPALDHLLIGVITNLEIGLIVLPLAINFIKIEFFINANN